MEDITKYLEGQYDGSGLQRGAQQMGDLVRAYEMERRAEEAQLQAWEEEERRIASIYGVSETDRYGVGNLMKAYAEEDKYNEYLVDGAVLTCDQATLEPFSLPDGEKIILEVEPMLYPEIRRRSILKVKENPVFVNGKTYATVRDTIKGENVMPFRCNCKQEVNRNEEAERIKADPECAKYGVCRHLMQLNEKWDNMPRATGYMQVENRIPKSGAAGAADILDISYDESLAVGRQEGITMTSVLFCKHGGLIRAVRSGQETVIAEEENVTDENGLDENERMKEAYDTMNKWLLEGYLIVSEEELIQAMEYLAENGRQNSISSLRKISDEIIDGNIDTDLRTLYQRINDSIERQVMYDNMILAWTNYWNIRMECEFGEGNYVPVRADVVKAMVVDESNMGQDNRANNVVYNGQRDIKQALDCRNPVVWIVVNEFGNGRTITIKYAEEDVEKFGIDNSETRTIEIADGGPGVRAFFENGSYKVVQNIFSEDYSIYYADRVTPEMSLAVGVGYYCELLNGYSVFNNGKSVQNSEEYAARRYNGGGNPSYVEEVNIILENMGVDVLGSKNE